MEKSKENNEDDSTDENQEEKDFNLIKEWSDKLNFEDYVINWKTLATTSRTELFNTIKSIPNKDVNYRKVKNIKDKIVKNNTSIKKENTEPITDEKTETDVIEDINKMNDINIKTIEQRSTGINKSYLDNFM